MKKVKTADGSVTFHDSTFDETYHSTTGAKEEADKKYAEACGIAGRESVDILDICFGLGYNSAAAVDMFTGKRLRIVGLEVYQGIVDEIVSMVDANEYPFECAALMKEVASAGKYSGGNVSVSLVMGDALETIKKLDDDSFDVVFLDPFSPKRCPALWTAEFFEDIYRVLRSGGLVATYSCAGSVRRNFKAAGFSVSDGPVVGRRSPGTIARKPGF
jgi:tRNA U34 5-methylaminomethyl-2-thiouridine-forming methyltransferase MnmC